MIFSKSFFPTFWPQVTQWQLIAGLSVLIVLSVSLTLSQESRSEHQTQSAIEDNSFLIEEAFNQEEGVVQHISNGMYFSKPQEDFAYTFTQEWPLKGQAHQLSFTVPYLWLNGNAVHGLGDVLINYRYQLFTDGDWAWVAPRVSVILPTGKSEEGLGNGVVGMQVAIPVSRQLSEYWIIHMNAGLTLLPDVQASAITAGIKRTLISPYLGGSAIWLASSNFNVMLESMVNWNAEIGDNGEVVHNAEVIVNPGVRFAINLDRLQIVPGIAMPLSFMGGEHRAGIFFYLSFEHPF